MIHARSLARLNYAELRDDATRIEVRSGDCHTDSLLIAHHSLLKSREDKQSDQTFWSTLGILPPTTLR
jgi:hypothetical protein